jgi:3-phenylpropionate/trans-cinnamate dioxygenase ferredoxin subunit
MNQKNERIMVGSIDDLRESNFMKMTVAKHDYLVIQYQGQIYVVDDRCPHMGGSLSKGALTEHFIQCPIHKATFDFINGEVVQDAKIAFIKMKVNKLRTYPVTIENNQIIIEI